MERERERVWVIAGEGAVFRLLCYFIFFLCLCSSSPLSLHVHVISCYLRTRKDVKPLNPKQESLASTCARDAFLVRCLLGLSGVWDDDVVCCIKRGILEAIRLLHPFGNRKCRCCGAADSLADERGWCPKKGNILFCGDLPKIYYTIHCIRTLRERNIGDGRALL